jgi:hypothetical protein
MIKSSINKTEIFKPEFFPNVNVEYILYLTIDSFYKKRVCVFFGMTFETQHLFTF